MLRYLNLLLLESHKLWQLRSFRLSLLLMLLLPLLWAYAPGILAVYGVALLSAYQVPGLALLSSMEFLLPLLVAVVSAQLFGLEHSYRTLPTVLLRPLPRWLWLVSKMSVALVYPLLLLALLLAVALLAGWPLGYGDFWGGTGVGVGGLAGQGMLGAAQARLELVRAYAVAGVSLMPISLLALCLSVVFMNAASGALATLAVLIFMQLLVIFPRLEPYLLSTQLSAYAMPSDTLPRSLGLIALYSLMFAAAALLHFDRRDI